MFLLFYKPADFLCICRIDIIFSCNFDLCLFMNDVDVINTSFFLSVHSFDKKYILVPIVNLKIVIKRK